MKLKNINFDHSQEGFHAAVGVDENVAIRCRERVFFTHFANSCQALDLFGSYDLAPKGFTTLTGDLERCLQSISDPLEYEITLLHFMSLHKIANQAFSYYVFINDPKHSPEEKLKIELLKTVAKLKRLSDDNDENDSDDDNSNDSDPINIDTVTSRIDVVKKSNYNFSRYMELMGYVEKNYDDVDQLLNGLFN